VDSTDCVGRVDTLRCGKWQPFKNRSELSVRILARRLGISHNTIANNGVKLRWHPELDRFQRVLHFDYPLPRSIKIFVNDIAALRGAGVRDWRSRKFIRSISRLEFFL
jgi:hypothetical protein